MGDFVWVALRGWLFVGACCLVTSTLQSCVLGTGQARLGVCDMLSTFDCIYVKINKSGRLREESNMGLCLDKFCFLII